MFSKPLSLDLLIKRFEYGEIEFNSESKAWNETERSRFIESLLLGIPLQGFYFDTSNDTKWVVIDGSQRLSAIKDFVEDKLELCGLQVGVEFNGMKFSQLSHNYQRLLRETELSTCMFPKYPDVQKRLDLYNRLNMGRI